jgi:hypothetical protein
MICSHEVSHLIDTFIMSIVKNECCPRIGKSLKEEFLVMEGGSHYLGADIWPGVPFSSRLLQMLSLPVGGVCY